MAARTRITFATCNLYNLNLPGKPIYYDSDGWSQSEYKAKIDWLSRMFTVVGAGCWGFQELCHLHNPAYRRGRSTSNDSSRPDERHRHSGGDFGRHERRSVE